MIDLEVWLYGALSRYASGGKQQAYAQLRLTLPEGTRMRDLVEHLGLPREKKGITFVNGQLTDLPGLAADLERELKDGDRIGLFDDRSMWPFQYRFGASLSPELNRAMLRQEGGAIHHSFPPPGGPTTGSVNTTSDEQGGDPEAMSAP